MEKTIETIEPLSLILISFTVLTQLIQNSRIRFLRFLDDGNIGCGVFVDLQKAFGTVDHQILLGKLNHYEICGVSDNCFKSYLSNRNQYASINGYDSGLAALICDVP